MIIVFASYAPSIAGTDGQSEFMDNIKNIWYYVFAPDDYSNLLVDDEIDISKSGTTKRFEFINKYKGNHSVGIFLRDFSKCGVFSEEYLKNNRFTLKIKIDFYVNNSLALSKIVEGFWSPFLSQKGGGLIFVFYKTPKDLPINKTILCEVKVIEPDKKLSDTYGPARFYIGKESDE